MMATVPKGDAPEKTRAEKVDEFADLDQKVAAFKRIRDRHELLKAEIQGWCADLPGDQSVELLGHKFSVVVGQRQKQRTVHNQQSVFSAMKKAIGLERLVAMIKIPVGEIDKWIPKEDHKKYLTEARTGPRPIEAFPRNLQITA